MYIPIVLDPMESEYALNHVDMNTKHGGSETQVFWAHPVIGTQLQRVMLKTDQAQFLFMQSNQLRATHPKPDNFGQAKDNRSTCSINFVPICTELLILIPNLELHSLIFTTKI